MMKIIKKTIKFFIPQSLIFWNYKKNRKKFHEDRYKKINKAEKSVFTSSILGDDYESVIQYLIDQGIPEFHVRQGSVPSGSLDFINKNIFFNLHVKTPLKVLHVGNFVGVSLAYFAEKSLKCNQESVVFAIDPNITHREVDNPQKYVINLLIKCGLQKNVVLITSYSGKKSISNDGIVFGSYNPLDKINSEQSCEDAIHNLKKCMSDAFDVVFLDGNHQASYLVAEIQALFPLLRSKAFLILDDVDEHWDELRQVFKNIEEFGLQALYCDGRVGIAQKK